MPRPSRCVLLWPYRNNEGIRLGALALQLGRIELADGGHHIGGARARKLLVYRERCGFTYQVHSYLGLTLKPFFNFSKRPGLLTERKVVRGESFPKPPALANEDRHSQ